MSLYAYKESQELAMKDYGFYALIMAAMRKADADNLFKLQRLFPETWLELKARYSAPGGKLMDE